MESEQYGGLPFLTNNNKKSNLTVLERTPKIDAETNPEMVASLTQNQAAVPNPNPNPIVQSDLPIGGVVATEDDDTTTTLRGQYLKSVAAPGLIDNSSIRIAYLASLRADLARLNDDVPIDSSKVTEIQTRIRLLIQADPSPVLKRQFKQAFKDDSSETTENKLRIGLQYLADLESRNDERSKTVQSTTTQLDHLKQVRLQVSLLN